MAGVALSAAALGLAAGVHRRSESFRRLAASHLQAHSLLVDEAGGPLACGTGLTESDIDRIFCGRGPRECRAYRAAMYHYELSEKYRLAADRPWSCVADDPPAPPGANPKFEADPLYYELVSGQDTDSGFK
jgi:hypothetical protein